ncbi:MAG: hypothetical protein JO271_17035 [Verrucomicrobia bacterium]|nr:hypothetical protein [Verrucomicrobiota bacterium]
MTAYVSDRLERFGEVERQGVMKALPTRTCGLDRPLDLRQIAVPGGGGGDDRDGNARSGAPPQPIPTS